MATVVNTITLKDRMSDTLNKISKNLQGLQDKMSKTSEKIDAFGIAGSLAMGVVVAKTVQLAETIAEVGDNYTMLQSRMNLLVDSAEELKALNDSIYNSSVRARTSYNDLANVVTQLGTNAGASFNNDMNQITAFAELLTKSFAVAGADSTAIASTMYNLTQSLSTGKLMSQDYRIIKQNAPIMIKYLQEYFDTNASGLDEMVSKGQVTAEAIRNAMFTASDDINDKFNSMDVTFGQAMTNMKNKLFYAFTPTIQLISGAFAQAIQWISDNLDIILPFAVSMLTAIGIIIIATIIPSLITALTTLWGMVVAFVTMNAPIIAVALLIGGLLGLLLLFPEALGNIVGGVFAIGTAFTNVCKFVANLWIDLINLIISALNKIPGVNIEAMSRFDYGSIAESFENGKEVGSEIGEKIKGFTDGLGSFNVGASSGFDIGSLGDISANTLDTANATKKMNKNGVKLQDDVKVDDESLKLLMDVATKKFTINYKQLTPTINATFGDIRETANVDDILGAIEEKTLKMMNSSLAY